MRPNIDQKDTGRSLMPGVRKMLFSFAFLLALLLAAAGGRQLAYAAPLEDCDLDGYDDATGAPVPWPGYDETKGDTPAGPGTGKVTAVTPTPAPTKAPTPAPTATPVPTVTATVAPTKAPAEETDSADSDCCGVAIDEANSFNTTNPEKESTTKGSDGATEGTATGDVVSASKKDGASNIKVTDKKETGAKGNGTKEAGTREAATNEVDAKKTAAKEANEEKAGANEADRRDSDVKTDSEEANTTGTEVTDTDTTRADVSANADAASNPDSSDQELAGQGEADQSSGALTNNEGDKIAQVAEELEVILNTKGLLEVKDASGSLIHAGSSLIITGTGFVGNLHDLAIEIQSEALSLGRASTLENGSFELQADIPETLEAGTHHIVVLYQGNEISRQPIQVGPRPADSFLEALSVGLTKENKGLLPGLAVLAGLLLIGLVALAGSALTKPRGIDLK